MERRMLLAVVLSILAVTGYSAVTGRGCLPKPPPKADTPAPGEPGSPEAPTPAPGGGDETPPAKDQPAAPAAQPAPAVDLEKHPQFGGPSARAQLASEELEVTFTTQGGAIESVRHRHTFESDGHTLFDQVVPVDPLMPMGAIDDVGVTPKEAPGGADRRNMRPGPMRLPELPWTLASSTADEVVFTFETPQGLIYRKAWSLGRGEGNYDVLLHLSVQLKPDLSAAPASVAVKLLAVSGHLREHTTGAFLTQDAMIYRLSSAADVSPPREDGLPLEELDVNGRNRARLRMLGSRSSYFLTAYYGTGAEDEPTITHFWATGEDATLRGAMENNLDRFYTEQRGVDLDHRPDLDKRIAEGVQQLHHAWLGLQLPVAAPQPAALRFYVGPMDRRTLSQDAYRELRPVVTYPNAPDFVADVLMWIYDIWRSLFGSAGLAVILMTLTVRGAMMPLSVRNQLSMRRYGRKVAKLKPKVKALQQRWASNPKKLREEQMKLYREHGVGFPTGCLMMLIQIPVFFALFSALRVEYTIRGESFLWIKDLSGPDRLVDFGKTVLNLGVFWIESINLLPLLMVGLSILHTRNMPKPADEQQAQQMKMMKWLPIVFAVILYNYTAALAIYMVLSSSIAIIESKIVRSKDEHEQAAEGVLPTA